MRDLIIALIVFGLIPIIIMRPHIGIYLWSWLSYMNPHRMSWGFAYSFPFAQITAIALIIALIFSKEKKQIPINGITVVWFLFIVWMIITTVFSLYPSDAYPQLIKVLKIQLITVLTVMLINDRERITGLVWVIFLSIGFFSIKGGVFTLVSGGQNRVWGPPDSYIEGNNELALATLMIVPLGFYLRHITKQVIIRHFLLLAMLLSMVSALGSQSRGALLGFFAVLGFFWLKSSKKLITGILALILLSSMLFFMPQHWHDRMATIENYQEDASAMGRINSWIMATNLSSDRLTGGGYEVWNAEIFHQYAPDPTAVHDAHSIYFEVLGEHGFIGLFLYLMIGFLVFIEAQKIIKKTKAIESLQWMNVLAKMLQVSFVAYAVGGAFLGLAYYDLYWHLVAIVVGCKFVLDKELKDSCGTSTIK